MQNLTARYNILYNARELIKESEQNIQLPYRDNYDVLISAFKEPNESLSQPELKKMDDVILKANTIINDKSQSKYVDDAYFVIAKANFLKSNFYNATEFFSYIYLSYPKQFELKQAALAYKARALMNSDRFAEAEATLDTAFKYLETEKNSVADLYAIKAQLSVYARKDAEAASLLEKAISYSSKGQNKIRWTYLLAQLQQLIGRPEAALENYTQVIKSNAPFEMAFNAKLKQLSIRDEMSGRVTDRDKQLLSLLKNDNNLDFADQVYFQIAEGYAKKGDIPAAIVNYNTSIRKSTNNDNQKGLSYLALADIYFKQADFVRSKAYFDSTLTSLSPQLRDYEQIVKKANSLELLADRLSVIAREDTLQMLAKLPEAERQQRVGVLVRSQAEKAVTPEFNANMNQGTFGMPQSPLKNMGSEKFYFNNPIALSQGLSDFKRVWGNRKLEDNWRRSQRSSSDLARANLNNSELAIPGNPDAPQGYYAGVEYQHVKLYPHKPRTVGRLQSAHSDGLL
jgi:tetratricopeptide (TPR) repeat protein